MCLFVYVCDVSARSVLLKTNLTTTFHMYSVLLFIVSHARQHSNRTCRVSIIVTRVGIFHGCIFKLLARAFHSNVTGFSCTFYFCKRLFQTLFVAAGMQLPVIILLIKHEKG